MLRAAAAAALLVSSAAARPNATCLAQFPTSIGCRWASYVEDWHPECRGLCRIAVIYYQPPTLRDGDLGLEAAARAWARATRRNVNFLNVADIEGADPALPGGLCAFLKAHFDHVIVKSNWDYVVDLFVRRHLWEPGGAACNMSRSLQIAGAYPPPAAPEALRFYDVLYYETPWYLGAFLTGRHPRAVHAFGVDADAARERCARTGKTDKDWDWMFAGAFGDHVGFKRPETLARLEGRRLAVGKIRDNAGGVGDLAREVVRALAAAGVEVREQVPWLEMLDLMAASKAVLIPDDWRGGGERAVLEARACGAGVAVQDDNPKLAQLSAGPVFTPLYYAGQLESGLLHLEAALRGARERETCGVAAVLGLADGCAWAEAYADTTPFDELQKPLGEQRMFLGEREKVVAPG